jgi:hypothetical protein
VPSAVSCLLSPVSPTHKPLAMNEKLEYALP